MKKLLPFITMSLLLAHFPLLAQKDTVTTYPTPGMSPGSINGVTFEIESTEFITIHKLEIATNSAGLIPVDIYYRPGGVQHTTGALPIVDSAYGWIQLNPTFVQANFIGFPCPTSGDMELALPPGNYGFYVNNASYDLSYAVWTYPLDSVFTHPGAAVSILTGPNKGYFGPKTAFYPTDTAQFVGSVIYSEIPHLVNDISMRSVEIADARCPGVNNIAVNLRNLGSTQINTLKIKWKVGASTTIDSMSFSGLWLDTLGGTGSIDTTLIIGNTSLIANGSIEIEAWTSMPNGQIDPILANDTASAIIATAMSGTYTIDSTGTGDTNFLNFNEAVDALKLRGVCGPVTFNVATNVYNEQVSIDPIEGTSATNTVTFRPSDGSVEIQHNAINVNDNYVVKFNGCSYVTFDGIKLTSNSTNNHTTIVLYENASHHNTVKNCDLNAQATTSTSTNCAIVYARDFEGNDHNTIENNHIFGGSYGIYYRGVSSSVRVKGIKIAGNTIEEPSRYGMYIYETENSEISGNTVSSNSLYGGSSYGIYVRYGQNLDVTDNIFQSPSSGPGSWPLYALYYRQSDGSTFKRSVIANNMIHVGKTSSSASHRGVYMYDCSNVDVIHNNIVTEGTSTSNYVAQLFGGLNNIVYNNNLLNYGQGYALVIDSGSFVSDYNNLASNGPNLAYYNGGRGAVADLTAWQATGHDNSSISVNSIFSNLDSLRTCDIAIYQKGFGLGYPAEDIDSEERSNTQPTIGADEFSLSPFSIDIGDSIYFCPGTEIKLEELNGEIKYGNYNWSTEENTPTIVVTEEGNYSLTLTACVSATDTVALIEHPSVDVLFSIEKNSDLPEDSAYLGENIGFTNNSEHALSYEWDFGDGSPVFVSQHAFHSYDSTGTYSVTLTAFGICDTITSTFEITVVKDYTGIDELTADQFEIYPNPASETFTLRMPSGIRSVSGQLTILTLNGQVVRKQGLNMDSGNIQLIDISELRKGVYVLQLQVENSIINKRLIVQ